MSSNGSPLIDAAQALYDHFRKAVDEMPMPPWVKNPDQDKSTQADPQMVADANKSFVTRRPSRPLRPTAAKKIRMKASGK